MSRFEALYRAEVEAHQRTREELERSRKHARLEADRATRAEAERDEAQRWIDFADGRMGALEAAAARAEAERDRLAGALRALRVVVLMTRPEPRGEEGETP